MSQFCGKCDFYDSFVAIGADSNEEKVKENLKNLKLYVYGKDGRDHRVKSDTIKDIAKYYPYLESVMNYSKESGYNVYLCSDSFIDQEEREHIGWYVRDVLKYWRKCKRNKKPFIVDECIESLHWMNDDILRTVAERVAKYGNKAEFDDIHDSLHEYYRRRWFEELVRLGYSEFEAYNWCFKSLFDSKETIIKRLGRPITYEIQSGATE